MRPHASYDITLSGSAEDILEALFCITDVICDQNEVLPQLLDKYDSDEDEIDDDDDDCHIAKVDDASSMSRLNSGLLRSVPA